MDKDKKVLDAVFCSIMVLDQTGCLMYYNHSAEMMFQSMGENLKDICQSRYDDFWSVVSEKIDPVNGRGRYHIDFKGKMLICNVEPLTENGERTGSIFVIHESMTTNCIMQELDVTTGLLQEINIFVEHSHDGFLVTDSEGYVVRINEAFEQMFSVQRKNIVGRHVRELIESGIYENSAALEVVQTKKAAAVAVTKGEKRIIATGTPVFDESGRFTSVVVNVRDITELNDLEMRLEHQRMVAEGYERELAYMQNRRGEQFVAHSKEMRNIMDTVKAISQVDSTVLITGESGTGKEVIVNYIYQTSSRKDKPIIKINCGAIPAALFESELFGYEEGAFTGAKRRGKAGFFELANGGTLFLDEVGELDLNLQVKLLRVIQEGEVTRIGGTRTIHVDVRIIAATNRDLWQQVREGKFRQDLYYRLNVINIEMPPLRERRDDIIPLALHFLNKFNEKYDKHKKLSIDLGKELTMLDWTGNIRELENLIENMVVLVHEDTIEKENLPSRYRLPSGGGENPQVEVHGILPLKEAVRQTEQKLIANAREKYTTTRELARVLGVDQSTISRKMGKWMEKK